MTRSIGDTHYECKGLIHTPTIEYREMTLDKGDVITHIVACDGAQDTLIEAKKLKALLKNTKQITEDLSVLDLPDIQKIIQANQNKSEMETAEAILAAAYYGEGERITHIAQAFNEIYNCTPNATTKQDTKYYPDREHRSAKNYFWSSGDNISLALERLSMTTSTIPHGKFIFDGHGLKKPHRLSFAVGNNFYFILRNCARKNLGLSLINVEAPKLIPNDEPSLPLQVVPHHSIPPSYPLSTSAIKKALEIPLDLKNVKGLDFDMDNDETVATETTPSTAMASIETTNSVSILKPNQTS